MTRRTTGLRCWVSPMSRGLIPQNYFQPGIQRDDRQKNPLAGIQKQLRRKRYQLISWHPCHGIAAGEYCVRKARQTATYETLKRNIMIRNYLKTFRLTASYSVGTKMYSMINIGGLAIGMSVSFMLLIYVSNEFSFDKFYPDTDRLYQVFRNQLSNHELNTSTATPILLAPAMQREYPDIEKIATGPMDLMIYRCCIITSR